MSLFQLEKDIQVLCVTADSFPNGIAAAFQKVHALVPNSNERKTFGISYANQAGDIIYKAAVSGKDENEAETLGLETFIIKRGTYISTIIHNYMQATSAIGEAFSQMLNDPRIDPQGACIEWYINDKEVQCMVRLE
ncbi:MAG: transcriptional regulator [Saprospiraceae bacterium]